MVKIDVGDKTFYIDGYLKTLLEGFKTAVLTKKTSAVFIIDGRSGMGKTTLNNQIGTFLDPNYNLDKIHFKPDEFLKALSEAKKGDYLCFDEGMRFSSRNAMSQINRMMIIALSMIRSKEIFITFCVNSFFDIDRNVALSRGDILFHVYGDSLVDRGNFCAFFKSKGGQDRLKQLYLLGKKMYSYSKPKANFYGRFYNKFLLDEELYEAKKQEGINEFLNQGLVPAQQYRKVEARLIKYLKNELKIKAPEIAEIAGINKSSVYNKLKIPDD